MLISQTFTWPVTNWPLPTVAATQYTVFQIYPAPTVINQVVTTNQATITYDDTLPFVWQIRPSGVGPVYGPELTTYVENYVPCRAFLRQKVRKSLNDRADAGAKVSIKWPDDELNEYIQEALGELNVLFPVDNTATVTLLASQQNNHGVLAGVRAYALPTDFYRVKTVEYVTSDGQFHKFLKEKPWIGGETTSNSIQGYPKLGIVLAPMNGRFYAGNFFFFNGTIVLDFDPFGDGDYLNLNYVGKRVIPTGDGDLIAVLPEDIELLSLRVQMKCWLRLEGQDASLSRWRTKDDGSKRDDMPTLKHSTIIKQLYNELVNDRRELRPRTYRLVRR